MLLQVKVQVISLECFLKINDIYMLTHPHWPGVTRIAGNLPTKKMLFDITRIRSFIESTEYEI